MTLAFGRIGFWGSTVMPANLPVPLEYSPAPLPVLSKDIRVVACPHPFSERIVELWLHPGMSLTEILAKVQPEALWRRRAYVWVDDEPVLPEAWDTTYPAWGAEIAVKMAPEGGGVGRIIGTVLVAIAVIAVSVLTYGALTGPAIGMSSMWAGALSGLAGMTVGIVGNLAMNAMFPVTANPSRQAALMGVTGMTSAYGSSVSSSPTYSLNGGSNQANKYGPYPKIFGIHKHFPLYGAETYTEVLGEDQYLHLYFVWCISRTGTPGVRIQDLKIGETAQGQYEGLEVEHRNLELVLHGQTIAIDVIARTLTRTSGSWLSEGIKAGLTVTLSGCTTPANNTGYLLTNVTALVLTWSTSTATTTEAGNGAQTASVVFGDEALTLYTNRIHEGETVQQILLEQGEPVVRTSQAGPRALSVDISLPSLFANDPVSGSRYSKTVTIKIEYCETGSGAWQTATTLIITAASNTAVRRGHRWEVNAGADPDVRYDVRVTRLEPGADDTLSSSISYWTALRSIWNTNPFTPEVPCAITVMRIKASNELSGTVDRFSGICSGIEPDWDTETETWITRITQNPASHLREMCQGPQNMDPYADDEIHLQQLQYFHEYCVAQGWKYNKIIDYEVDWDEIWAEIAAAGRAAIDWLDSMRSVIIDEPQEFTIGPAFTPRNSKNYSFQISYPDVVHCWRCAFKNELNDWADDERLVLLDGYALLDANGDKVDAWGDPAPALPLATIFVSLPILGVTHPDLIFKHARFHGAQLQLRFITHQFDAHLDQLVARRGKRFKFSQDVILAGSSWGRVKALVMEVIGYEPNKYGNGLKFGSTKYGWDPSQPIYSGNLAGVILDAPCPMAEGTEYAIRFRLGNNVSVLCNVVTAPGNLKELTFVDPLPPYDPGPPPVNYWPAVGDLFMFGERGKEAVDLLLHSIRPNNNLGAKITAVPYDEAIYLADQGVVPTHVPLVTIPQEWWTPLIAWVRSDGSVLWRDNDGSWRSRILISLRTPGALNVNIAGVEAQYWPTDSNTTPTTLPVVPLYDWEVSLMPVEDGVSYDFRLRYVKKDGSRGPWTSTQTHVVEGKTADPSDVTGFMVMQAQSLITARWVDIPDRDRAGYEVRYGGVGITWAAAALVNGEYKGTTFTTTDIPPGTWDVLIKAKDTSGNYSATETRKTLVVYQFYTILSEIEQAPLWAGTLVNCRRNPQTGNINPSMQAATIDDYFDVLFSYCHNPYTEYSYETPAVDLGEDKTVRLWARVQSNLAPGETGSVPPQLSVDYKLDGGAYDGFEDWSIGYLQARYVKTKITHQAADGLRRITGFQPVLDQAA
ncbi:MAG: hypothetical protein WC600_17230 [Desulfobaccales bacterium]